MILDGRMLAVAAGAQMGGNPLTPGEHLDGARGEPHLDRVLREAVGHAVIMPVDIDVIIDADPSDTPFGEHIGLDRQGLEQRSVEFPEEMAARHAEPADRPLVIDPHQERADRLVEFP